MPAIEWIWTLPSVITLLGFAAWIWQAAGDERDLDVVPDQQLLRAIACHLQGAETARQSAPVRHRAGFDQGQLQA